MGSTDGLHIVRLSLLLSLEAEPPDIGSQSGDWEPVKSGDWEPVKSGDWEPVKSGDWEPVNMC